MGNTPSSEPSATGVIEHPTFGNHLAYERTDNAFWWQIEPHSSSVIDEPPRPASISKTTIGAPITIYNNWPRRLSNAGLFHFLLPHTKQTQYADFYDFVKTWYQAACAIIYRDPQSKTGKVVGSGALVQISDALTMVATARHNFENFSEQYLYARFYRHEASRTDNPYFLSVKEQYLDVPVVRKHPAKSGLDAGYLEIDFPNDRMVLEKYARLLPSRPSHPMESYGAALPDGHYAMFHFSGGKPQISIGEIKPGPSVGGKLHDDIAIQAGPGASGAVVIWKGFNQVYGCGISIYRMLHNGYVDRRIISFSKFFNPGWIDNISAPYHSNPSFEIVPTSALRESGYEFLRYRSEAHVGMRVNKPVHNAYRVDEHHSTHHIIPIGDLLYLWDYFQHLDEFTVSEIHNVARSLTIDFKKRYVENLNREINVYHPGERTARWSEGMRRIDEQAERFKCEQFNGLYREYLVKKYQLFYVTLASLCPDGIDNRTGFAWSFWNLFKGWEKDYRTDDPADGCSMDFSEKTRPLHFNHSIWNCLKNDEFGLHRHVQQLKATQTPNSANETTILGCLKALSREWNKRSTTKAIHSYNEQEWEYMGQKDGHPLCRIKPP